jgi:hypothetical protein
MTRNVTNGIKSFFRHCERSEAIHEAARKNGLLRRYAAGNDGFNALVSLKRKLRQP